MKPYPKFLFSCASECAEEWRKRRHGERFGEILERTGLSHLFPLPLKKISFLT